MESFSRGYANNDGGDGKNYAKVLNDRRGGRATCACVVRVSRVNASVCGYMRARERAARGHLMSSGWLRMAKGAGFSDRYANKPLPDVSGVRFGLKLLLMSAGIIVGRIIADGTSRMTKESNLDYCWRHFRARYAQGSAREKENIGNVLSWDRSSRTCCSRRRAVYRYPVLGHEARARVI